MKTFSMFILVGPFSPHTYTHAHNGFYCKFYPLTLPLSLNLPLTGNILHFYIFKKTNKKTLLNMIYTLFSSWGPLAGPHKVGDFRLVMVTPKTHTTRNLFKLQNNRTLNTNRSLPILILSKTN